MKVFLVEDSELLRTRLDAMLATVPNAIRVGHASGARAAIAAILSDPPDVVVLDIHLDEGTGFDVMRALRQAGVAVDVYVLTNYPEDAYRRSAERLGARGFFDKSHELARLQDALAARAAA